MTHIIYWSNEENIDLQKKVSLQKENNAKQFEGFFHLVVLCFGFSWSFHQLLSLFKLKSFTLYNDVFVSAILSISEPLSFFP